MNEFQDINYALISALYASRTNRLYSDVYFPIIKYTIVQLFNSKPSNDGEQYYTSQDVHDFIEDKFKIHIPNIVIAKSIQKIENIKKGFVDLVSMENGNSFQIRKVWNSDEYDELYERENSFTDGLKSIEADYKTFLEQNGSYDDGVSYLQFIADNTKEVLGYFQHSDTSVIDEKYVTIIFFLEYLHRTPSKKDEFVIADQLFWASIIAGYLRSEKPPVDASEDGCKREYFLDTSILLGMMKLSTKQKEYYAQEVREIILSSGGIMRVHPMTIEEIKKILSSVEASAAPDPGTDIAEAWANYHLNINKIASIRLSLQSELEKLGIQMFPNVGLEECKRIERLYVGRKTVEELARERSGKSKSYTMDYFREIHDLFMDDYIKDRRKEKGGSESISFVTANRELITFTKRLHPDSCYMISTGRIVLELWMHNARPSDISSCVLTETMARCLDQHNARVRGKIAEVSRFFNENKGGFDPKVYQDFIKKLYRRAKNVIITVETDPDEKDTFGELTSQRILDAMKADQDFYDKRIHETEIRKRELESQLVIENISKTTLEKKNKLHEEHIDSLYRQNAELSDKVSETNVLLLNSQKYAKEMEIGKTAAENKVALYEKRDELYKEKSKIEAELYPMKVEREKSFKNRTPQWLMCGGIFLLVVAFLDILFSIIVEKYWMITLCAFLVPLGIFICGRANTLNDNIVERRAKAFLKWENDIENREYGLLKDKLEGINKKIIEIEKIL